MQKKIYKILIFAFFICSGLALILYNLSGSISFFYKPSQITETIRQKNNIRIGGMVKKDSISYFDVNILHFIITDDVKDIPVVYKGVVPQLFYQEQQVIVKGLFKADVFVADELLAKHDEKYKPLVSSK